MLIDEDDIDNIINQKIIEAADFAEDIQVYKSAREALDLLSGASADQLPQLIFLDINMPEMNGFEFLEAFSKLSNDIRSSVKIVMLSSSMSPKDIDKSASSPYVVKYINKPLNNRYLDALNF